MKHVFELNSTRRNPFTPSEDLALWTEVNMRVRTENVRPTGNKIYLRMEHKVITLRGMHDHNIFASLSSIVVLLVPAFILVLLIPDRTGISFQCIPGNHCVNDTRRS